MPPFVRRALSCFFLASICFAGLISEATESAWSVRAWQLDDGLPNNSVTGLAQTPDGYLWVATPSRLSRFDGMQFEPFSSRSIIPEHDERISTLLAGRDGALWLAMDHGP